MGYNPTGEAFMFLTAAIGAIVGSIVGGCVAAANGGSVLAGVCIGAAAGGLIGLGAGAAAGVLFAAGFISLYSYILTYYSDDYGCRNTLKGLYAE